jgi:hypothetical protein
MSGHGFGLTIVGWPEAVIESTAPVALDPLADGCALCDLPTTKPHVAAAPAAAAPIRIHFRCPPLELPFDFRITRAPCASGSAAACLMGSGSERRQVAMVPARSRPLIAVMRISAGPAKRFQVIGAVVARPSAPVVMIDELRPVANDPPGPSSGRRTVITAPGTGLPNSSVASTAIPAEREPAAWPAPSSPMARTRSSEICALSITGRRKMKAPRISELKCRNPWRSLNDAGL